MIICDFFFKYLRAGAINQSEIGNKHTSNFQNKIYRNF